MSHEKPGFSRKDHNAGEGRRQRGKRTAKYERDWLPKGSHRLMLKELSRSVEIRTCRRSFAHGMAICRGHLDSIQEEQSLNLKEPPEGASLKVVPR